MKLSKTIVETRYLVKEWKKQGLSVGFVPTMGYLHEGHGSLMAKARAENDRVVVSIFVNPTQFGAGEDLDKYPRNLEGDISLCVDEGVDLIFVPSVEEMYPTRSMMLVTMGGLTDELCGKSRPGHFSGVCLVVSKLFHIVPCDRSYFGEKDAQQLAIIRRMVKELDFDLEVVGCPIVRESDGLAMSSRNSYLSEEERKAGLILSKTLGKVRVALEEGERDGEVLREMMAESVGAEVLGKLDYGEVVDAETLQPVKTVTSSVLVALAVHFGTTRLIDNFTFKLEG